MSTSRDYADSLFVTGSLDRCHNSTTEFGNTSERIYNFRNSTLGDASRAVSCAQIEADRSAINSQCQVAVKGCGRHFRLDFFPLHRFRRGFRCASKGQTATASAQQRADGRRRHRHAVRVAQHQSIEHSQPSTFNRASAIDLGWYIYSLFGSNYWSWSTDGI